jgi:hypothetical protein
VAVLALDRALLSGLNGDVFHQVTGRHARDASQCHCHDVIAVTSKKLLVVFLATCLIWGGWYVPDRTRPKWVMSQVTLTLRTVELPDLNWPVLDHGAAVGVTTATVSLADADAEYVASRVKWHFIFPSSMRASRWALASRFTVLLWWYE